MSNVEQEMSNVQGSRDQARAADPMPACRFDLDERLIAFTVRIMALVEALPSTRAANHVAGQLVRSGSSSAPNYAEAQAAESRKDFIHKMKIALKELRETRVWLLIIRRKPMIDPPHKLDPLIGECNELIAIFASSIRTAQKNRQSAAQPSASAPPP